MSEERFGRWVVVEKPEKVSSLTEIRCKCDCGTIRDVRWANLKHGLSKSCGCLSADNARARATHGLTRGGNIPKDYHRWSSMIQRCFNPLSPAWKHYGGRGIKVCDRWLDFIAFRDDLGDFPDGMTIERIDNDGNYEPGNVRLASMKDQANNRRGNHLMTYNGRAQTMTQWCEELDISYSTMKNRVHKLGMTDEEAISTPLQLNKRNKGRRISPDSPT